MKKLISILMFGATIGANAQTHSAANAFNPGINAVYVTNTIGLTNLNQLPVGTNTSGVNTNYNPGGIIYTNNNTILGSQGTGQRYETVASAINGTQISTNNYSTNDANNFFWDVPISPDRNGNVKTNFSLYIDATGISAWNATTNLILYVAPIAYGELNKPTTKLDLVNVFAVNVAGIGSGRVSKIIPISGQFDIRGVKGLRLVGCQFTNAGAAAWLTDLRLLDWTP